MIPILHECSDYINMTDTHLLLSSMYMGGSDFKVSGQNCLLINVNSVCCRSWLILPFDGFITQIMEVNCSWGTIPHEVGFYRYIDRVLNLVYHSVLSEHEFCLLQMVTQPWRVPQLGTCEHGYSIHSLHFIRYVDGVLILKFMFRIAYRWICSFCHRWWSRPWMVSWLRDSNHILAKQLLLYTDFPRCSPSFMIRCPV